MVEMMKEVKKAAMKEVKKAAMKEVKKAAMKEVKKAAMSLVAVQHPTHLHSLVEDQKKEHRKQHQQKVQLMTISQKV